jgi:hypothetical protein
VRVAGDSLPVCDATIIIDCMDGNVARLGPPWIDRFTLVSDAGEGTLTVTGPEVATLLVELR